MILVQAAEDASGIPLTQAEHVGGSPAFTAPWDTETSFGARLTLHTEARMTVRGRALLDVEQNMTTEQWPVIALMNPSGQRPIAQNLHPSAVHMLTDRVRGALSALVPLIEQHSARSYVRLHRIDFTGFTDPEDDSQEVVMTLYVGLSPSAALRYWEKVGEAIERWTPRLPPELQTVMYERIAVEVVSTDLVPVP